ncbi:MAG: hypothetical protein PHN55_08815 [Dysgonamonadaceae bacterium]|nr:hypothetical protein [Dysgonamonadaceae bacterium]
MEQLNLFNKLVTQNCIWDAHTVGKNLYNKNLGDQTIFEKYFNFLILVAGYPIEIETRKYFVSEAETALIFFSENAHMDTEQLNFIRKCREDLMQVTNDIKCLEFKIYSEKNEKIVSGNNICLSQLVELKGKLFTVNQQNRFDNLLLEVNAIENSLRKEFLTEEQKALYDSLTKEYSNIISKKMYDLNQMNCAEYNKTAVKDFKYVFEEFKKNEAKYKNSQSQLFALVSKRLFSYDAAKLFNETLIYYNHIYSFIFSKLDDDGKFNLTQIAIDTEKVNR